MTRRTPPPPPHRSSRGSLIFMVIFTLAATGIWLTINKENIQEYRETYERREQARQKIIETRATISNLHRQQQSLNYNGHESRKQIRERLQMHHLGEQVVYFEHESDKKQTTTTLPAAQDQNSNTTQ